MSDGVDELLQGHRRFRRKALTQEREFLRRLASEGQSPDALVIGCADSRVVPELLTHASPGDLFVVRNIANLVPPLAHLDASVGAAIEYAIGHLHVPHVIVCGHYGCGGVRAVMEQSPHLAEFPSLHEWLGLAKEAVHRVKHEDEAAWWRAAVEENVVEQLSHLTSFPLVAAAVEAGGLSLHGWVYDLHSLDLQVYNVETDTFLPASALAGGPLLQER